MSMYLSDLVADVLLCKTALKDAEDDLKIAESKLIDALAFSDVPLPVGGRVVIGDKMFERKYETLPLVISNVPNVSPGTSVEV